MGEEKPVKKCPNCIKIEKDHEITEKFRKELEEEKKWLTNEAPKGYCGISKKDGCDWLTTGSFAVKKEVDGFLMESRSESGSDYIMRVSWGDLKELLDFLKEDYEIIYDKNQRYQLVIAKSAIQLAELTDDRPKTIKMFQPNQKEEALKMLEKFSGE